jgi:hypothetical protein
MATSYERLDYGSVDGSQWGASTDVLAFYGSVPVTISSVPNMSTATDTGVISSLVIALKRIGIIA